MHSGRKSLSDYRYLFYLCAKINIRRKKRADLNPNYNTKHGLHDATRRNGSPNEGESCKSQSWDIFSGSSVRKVGESQRNRCHCQLIFSGSLPAQGILSDASYRMRATFSKVARYFTIPVKSTGNGRGPHTSCGPPFIARASIANRSEAKGTQPNLTYFGIISR